MEKTREDDKDFLKEFGEGVRALRKAKGLSQEDLGEKTDLHNTYIGGIERGERNPSLKNAARIAHVLGVDLGELFSGGRSLKTRETGLKMDVLDEIRRLRLEFEELKAEFETFKRHQRMLSAKKP
ncbi:MAG: helix-turn-helix transcriptional regulator [Deltaproteobacteria bacterium]|nr:helix-turn-helix transcriptional regulator [Deltaproteobacteria bacterium]